MEQSIGKRIREFRLRADMTQETLAETLGLTAQAVSKWENGVSLPDITLLPELTSALGMTLDELFDSSADVHLRRIEQMLEREDEFTDAEFSYAESRLLKDSSDPALRGRCLTLLADLYNGRADRYHRLAEEKAKEALAAEPDKKDNHTALTFAAGGEVWDWCCSNHTRVIDYYKDFVRKNPGYAPGYLWLLDNLLADCRLDEAREAVDKMETVRNDFRVDLYRGWIAERGGDRAEADRIWREMTEKYPGDWIVWSCLGDAFAKRADYAAALADYRRAAELDTAPRLADNWDSIAQICTIIGDRASAAEAYKNVLSILRDDWGMTEGASVDFYAAKLAAVRE